jgi:hypothetical protein
MAAHAQALKLVALDREGLGVISAHIQDTCVKRVDMTWLPKQRRFLIAGMRYDWVGAKTGPEERVSSVLRFDRVLKVSHLGLEKIDSDATLNLLGMTFEKTDPPAGIIVLAFADGALVRLDVECVEVEMRDIGHRVLAQACPGHALTATSAA